MSVLELNFLGGMNIQIDGSPLTMINSEKGKALLCYLAVTGTKESRSALSGLFWTEFSEENARASLRKTLSRLKPHLSSHLIVTRDAVAFNKDAPHRVDVADFETGAIGEFDIHRLQESIEHYKGDFLKDFHVSDAPLFNDWAESQRERLRNLALDTFKKLVGHCVDQKEYDLGILYARRLLSIEPWHENAHCQLMYMLASSGQRSAALKQFEECRKILLDELDVEPSSSTMELLEKVRQGQFEPGNELHDYGWIGLTKSSTPILSSAASANNLPTMTGPMMGRQHELEELAERLTNPDVRLVTITGTGGVGKTSLALAASHQLAKLQDFRDGVFFVPLSAVTTRPGLLSTITEHFGLSLAGTRKPEAVIYHYLRDKAALIVLDNFEQILPELDFLERLLHAAPRCKLLITSRERLKMQEEWVLDLEGLQYPNTLQEAQQAEYDAIKLFSERAQQVRSGFSLTDEIQGVIRICQLTQGLPLALEQAASLVRLSQAAEIADQIEERLDALATSLRNIPERHRSIRAVFDETWHWLSDKEKMVFCRLSVFQGGFTREAVEQVTDASFSTLTSLVDKSMLQTRMGHGQTTRYELHPLVQQYTAGKLLQTGQSKIMETHEAHFSYYLSLAQQASHYMDTDKEWEWLNRLERERENLYVALRWAIEQKKADYALKLNAALWTFWIHNSPAGEADDWLKSTLSMEWSEQSPTTMKSRARVLNLAGYAALQISDFELAELRFQEGAKLHKKLGDQRGLAWSLRGSGSVYMIRGNLAEAQNYMQESWDICRKIQNKWALAWSAYGMGNVALASDELEKAESFHNTAMAYFRQDGRELGAFLTLIALGHLKRKQGERAKAMACYKEALSIQERTRYIHYVAQILEGLAHIAVVDNNIETAVQLLGAAQARRDSIEMKRWAHHEVEFQNSLSITKRQLTEPEWQDLWEKGYEMSSTRALKLAMSV